MLCPFISCSDKLLLRPFYVPDLHTGMYNTKEYKVASIGLQNSALQTSSEATGNAPVWLSYWYLCSQGQFAAVEQEKLQSAGLSN